MFLPSPKLIYRHDLGDYDANTKLMIEEISQSPSE